MRDKIERIDISKIKDPKFLESLSYPELEQLCVDLREEIIDKCSTYGGHLSSNLGTVELTVALHRVFDFSKDKIIFDVGHQCYTHKLLSGRSLENIKHRGYVSGFQKRSESIYDVYEAGHSSTSISAAQGFAIARNFNKENYEIVAVIGWLFLWDGLEVLLSDRSEIRRKQIRSYRLMNAKVHVRRYSRKIQRAYGIGEFEEEDE